MATWQRERVPRQVVAEASRARLEGRSVRDVARRHDVDAQELYRALRAVEPEADELAGLVGDALSSWCEAHRAPAPYRAFVAYAAEYLGVSKHRARKALERLAADGRVTTVAIGSSPHVRPTLTQLPEVHR